MTFREELDDGTARYLQVLRRHEWEDRIVRFPVKDLSWKARAIGLAIAKFADGNGFGARPSQELLGLLHGVTDRTIRDHMKPLEALGLIVKLSRKRPEDPYGYEAHECVLTFPADLSPTPRYTLTKNLHVWREADRQGKI